MQLCINSIKLQTPKFNNYHLVKNMSCSMWVFPYQTFAICLRIQFNKYRHKHQLPENLDKIVNNTNTFNKISQCTYQVYK